MVLHSVIFDLLFDSSQKSIEDFAMKSAIGTALHDDDMLEVLIRRFVADLPQIPHERHIVELYARFGVLCDQYLQSVPQERIDLWQCTYSHGLVCVSLGQLEDMGLE